MRSRSQAPARGLGRSRRCVADFTGLTELEIASVLQRSERSVRRDWQAAKLWLYQRLAPELGDGR